jgi:hypothetical protein
MALHHLPALFSLLVIIAPRVTADANFTMSKAVYYPNSDTRGTESKLTSNRNKEHVFLITT